MSALTEALNRIFNWLQQHNPKAISYLKPGLTYAEIEELTKNFSVLLPQEVYELYQWRNGSNSDAITFIFDNMELLPLQKALKLYKVTRQSKPDLFPLFFSEAELKYSEIVLQGNFDNYPITFSDAKEYDLVELGYTSLTSMILTIAECYENGAYDLIYDEKLNDFIRNSQKINEVYHKYNYEIIVESNRKIDEALFKLEHNLSLKVLDEVSKYLIKDNRAVEPLIEVLQVPLSKIYDPVENMGIRSLAANILGQIGDSRAVEPLIYALQDSYWMTRYEAAKSLYKLKNDRAVLPLINILQDSEKNVRRMAAFALVYFQALEPLVEALNHNNYYVRQEAVWVLGEIGDSTAAESVIKMLQDSESNVRESAREAWTKLVLISPELENMIPF